MNEMHTPPEYAEPIYRWYKRAQVEYIDYYIKLYVSYNAWYREVTGSMNDRQALSQLKNRVIIWDDYIHARTMQSLKPYMERLVEITQLTPLAKTFHWSGSLENEHDWRALIEFWYQVRCLLVHGSTVSPKIVWLAYETLNIFMEEIITRMNNALRNQLAPLAILEENTIKHEDAESRKRYGSIRDRIYAKYFTSPDLWQVDMRRVEGN